MAFRDLTDPAAVLDAIEEYDRLGAKAFLDRYGFGQAQRYVLIYRRRPYDSKAIVGAAHGYQFDRPLRRNELFGGVGPRGAVRKLRELGFTVVESAARVDLDAGRVYSWSELGAQFGFAPNYPTIAGGMMSRPDHNALLLITHPRGARSFDYHDEWDGDDLIYTGRGKRGDQRYEGPNRDVGENARELHVFEPAGSRLLRYIGQARCIDAWRELALDLDGDMRSVWRFQLRFSPDARAARAVSEAATRVERAKRLATSRPFDPRHTPSPAQVSAKQYSPEEIARKQEKAVAGHHRILVALHARLEAAGWTDLEDMPTAIDLWGRNPRGVRVIFEAKTLRPKTERARVRGALAQLLEYRYECGEPRDRLCLVTDYAVSTRRQAFLESLGVLLITCVGSEVYAGSVAARKLFGNALSS